MSNSANLLATAKTTNYLLIGLAIVLVIGFSVVNFPTSTDTVISEAGTFASDIPLQSQYTLQDSSGKILSTNANLKPKIDYNIYIKNELAYPPEKIDAIKDAIISTETIEVENSLIGNEPVNGTTTFFKGWVGAGISLRQTFDILEGKPPEVHFVDTPIDADVILTLTDHRSGDGSLGWTNTVIDEETNEIIGSTITLYNFDELTIEKISIITRHEIGHAVGLGHSTDPNSLMYPTIDTDYPYISECEIIAKMALNLGKAHSEVVC